MATMLPERPKKFEKYSLEDVMFHALENLPPEYYVFHSFKIVTVKDNTILESETDFVIFNASKGILCLEAKAGKVSYKDGTWFYGNGDQMNNDGPYSQASSNKWKLYNYLKDHQMTDILDNCKFVHAVWFPSIDRAYFNKLPMTSETEKALTLTSEALEDPEKYIEALFRLKVNKADTKTDLSGYQVKRLFNDVLCPSFDIVPTVKHDMNTKKVVYNRLIEEQAKIFNYLEDQPNAVISGVAGSGKTMLAIAKAKKCAEKEEKTLFLCYNAFLNESLRKDYSHENVDYYTIDGLACKLCKSDNADIKQLAAKLEELYYNNEFPYKHVIIDEGQDFGQNDIEESNILSMLETIVLSDTVDGTFYIFYDKLQLVQGKKVPDYIQNADCKLCLYKNCRNTENIAITSMRPVKGVKKPKLFGAAILGDEPRLYIVENNNVETRLKTILDEYQNENVTDIVILTCKSERESALAGTAKNGVYNYNKHNYKFTTCRKFKGLEADVIILIDADKDTFCNDDDNNFYVGTSRARFSLNIIARLSDDECNEVLTYFGEEVDKRPKKSLASYLNAKYVK